MKWNLQAVGNRCKNILKSRECCANIRHYYYYYYEENESVLVLLFKNFGWIETK